MTPEGSITRWLGPLKAGDEAAIQAIWERYYTRLVGLARKKLGGFPKRAADEEDAALSAFESFCLAAEEGRCPQLFDRDDLWHLLVVITRRKAQNLMRGEAAKKRGGDRIVSDEGLAEVFSKEPDPVFAAQSAEEFQRLLRELEDDTLRRIALLKLEGFTNEQIAEKIERAVGTVERKLKIIRDLWEKELPDEC